MSYIDQKYINLISSHLDRFKIVGRKFNFRCPYCGDSVKNLKKARGWLLPSGNSIGYYFYCHNCNKNTTFANFIKNLDYGLFKEYQKEHYQPDSLKIDTLLEKPLVVTNTEQFETLPTISSLDSYHHAKKYLENRRIPKKWFDTLRYTDNFKKFTNTLIPNKFENDIKNDSRIVIPFYDYDGKLFGYQGRALYETNARYITIILNENVIKLFNLNNVNFNQRYYVVEGPIDAMFLYNTVAIAGAQFSDLPNIRNAVIVYDNEPRNADICKLMNKAINNRYKVCILPEHIDKKDINEMVLAGYTSSELQAIIDDNTRSGLSAKLEFETWKKV